MFKNMGRNFAGGNFLYGNFSRGKIHQGGFDGWDFSSWEFSREGSFTDTTSNIDQISSYRQIIDL